MSARCLKAPHVRGGYLHAEDDDTPYRVDGALYCGRCHYACDPDGYCGNPVTRRERIIATLPKKAPHNDDHRIDEALGKAPRCPKCGAKR